MFLTPSDFSILTTCHGSGIEEEEKESDHKMKQNFEGPRRISSQASEEIPVNKLSLIFEYNCYGFILLILCY
jgi:hypothetical protein